MLSARSGLERRPWRQQVALFPLAAILVALLGVWSVEGQERQEPEPRQKVTIGRACAHNDGIGRLTAEVAFRYPDNEVVIVPSAGLEPSDRVLLIIEWHVRDRSPIRKLTSDLEAQLKLEYPPAATWEIESPQHRSGEDREAREVYDEVNVFEKVVELTPIRPLCIVECTLKATAETALDSSSQGPQTRTLYLVRQTRVAPPEEAVSISRVLTLLFRFWRGFSLSLKAHVDFMNRVGFALPQPTGDRLSTEELVTMTRGCNSGLSGDEKDCAIAEDDWKVWDSFWRRRSGITNERVREALALSPELNKAIRAGLENELDEHEMGDVLRRLEGQFQLRRLTLDALTLSTQCGWHLLRMLGLDNREALRQAAVQYNAVFGRLVALLNELQESLGRVIGIQVAAQEIQASSGVGPELILLPADSTPLGNLIGGEETGDGKKRRVESVRARLFPLWLLTSQTGLRNLAMINRRAFGNITVGERETGASQPSPASISDATMKHPLGRAALAPTADISPIASIVGNEPQMSIDRGTSGANARTSSSSPLRGGEGQRKMIRLWDFSDGLKGWEVCEESGRHPGIHSVEVKEESGLQYLELHRQGSGLTLCEVGVRRRIEEKEVPLDRLRTASLLLEFRIMHQSLPSRLGSVMSYPLRLELQYLDETDSEQRWEFGFTVSGTPPPRAQGVKTTEGQWMQWRSIPLGELLPSLKRLTGVQLSAAGWDFTAQIRLVGLVGAE